MSPYAMLCVCVRFSFRGGGEVGVGGVGSLLLEVICMRPPLTLFNKQLRSISPLTSRVVRVCCKTAQHYIKMWISLDKFGGLDQLNSKILLRVLCSKTTMQHTPHIVSEIEDNAAKLVGVYNQSLSVSIFGSSLSVVSTGWCMHIYIHSKEPWVASFVCSNSPTFHTEVHNYYKNEQKPPEGVKWQALPETKSCMYQTKP